IFCPKAPKADSRQVLHAVPTAVPTPVPTGANHLRCQRANPLLIGGWHHTVCTPSVGTAVGTGSWFDGGVEAVPRTLAGGLVVAFAGAEGAPEAPGSRLARTRKVVLAASHTTETRRPLRPGATATTSVLSYA